jgi:hypothetical protein
MGPPPKNCRHEISRSLFVMSLGLFHEGLHVGVSRGGFSSRVERTRYLLAASGQPSASALAQSLRLPPGGWHCRTLAEPRERDADMLEGSIAATLWPDASALTAEARALTAAIILGMCAPGYFSPDRPVIWSEARLSRVVALVKPQRYYAS